MAELNNLSCSEGEAFSPQFTLSPVEDISGWTIAIYVKKSPSDAGYAITKAGTLVTPAGGVFKIAMSASDTMIAPGNYVYDIWRTDVGSECVLSRGIFFVMAKAK
jgi:hypothetical protein